MSIIRMEKFAKITKSRAFRIASNTVSTLILIVSIILCAIVVISAKSSTGVPNFAGYSFLSVRSDSMEPTFFVGDLIIVRRYNAMHEYKKGDIISFIAYDGAGEMFINTHRVEEVVRTSKVSYVTKGDNVDSADTKRVNPSKILGQYTGKRYAGMGKILEFANSSKGVLFTVVIPAAIIVVWQLLSYLLSLSDKRSQLEPQTQPQAQAPQQQMQQQQMQQQIQQQIQQQVQQQIQQQMQQQRAETQSVPRSDPAASVDVESVIYDYLQKQQQEEKLRQRIIDEYLIRQKVLEQVEKEKAERAEEEKIKALISEILAQQARENDQNKQDDSNNQNS